VRPRVALLATAVVAAALLPGAAMADTSIGALAAPTPVRAWAGIAVLSVLDPETGGYQLATQSGTKAPQPLPGIASAAQPFDADIGPGPGGAATIVFARCQAPGHCRLARTTPNGGSETPISGSAATDGWESAPTVWGSHVAFARQYASGSQRVYIRPLDAGARVRSVRLPGVPARECDEITHCRRIDDGTLRELELRGSTLAENVHFGLATVGICGEGQMRLVDVAHRTSRRLTTTICGLSGATLLGTSLTSTHLLFARICPGDPGACQHRNALVYRYGLVDRSFTLVAQDDLLAGFAALDDAHAIEVREPSSHDGNCSNHVENSSPACELALAGPFAFSGRTR
jgi:hypothetical protein